MKKLTSLVLATGMVLSLAACGGSGSSTAASPTNTDGSTATTDTAAADESNLGYEYGEHFHSDEPVTYTMFFNDNPAYPMNDKWINEGVFKAIEEATNVHLELTVVDNSNYTDKVSLAVSSGTSPYIIPKIYSETAYVTGGGVVPVSDYVQYMPNYSNFVEEYNMQDDLATITQADGKYYRLPGLKNVAQLLWEKARDFLERAFTVIFIATIVIWFLQNFDPQLSLTADPQESILALVASCIAPLFAPLGFADWRVSTALITGFMAKESVVSTLTILYGSSAALGAALSPAAAAPLLVFCLLYTPCIAAVASVKRELGRRWAAVMVLNQCVVAWVAALIVRLIALVVL